MADMPGAEIAIDAPLVRSLLDAQHPDLAASPIERVAVGWDNEVWRLGDALAVRLPRRSMGADLLAREQAWLPALAARLPLPVPTPVRVGVPDERVGYPWAWSIVAWVAGDTALAHPPLDRMATATTLGRFLAALHVPASPEVTPNVADRGAPLARRDAALRPRLARLAPAARERALSIWEDALATPPWSGPPVWVHGDLHPGNVLVDDAGALASIIDWGDIGAGDPAVDLSVGWMLLTEAERPALRAEATIDGAAVDDATWVRARASALAHALAVLANSDDHPVLAAMGRHTLDQVLADHP